MNRFLYGAAIVGAVAATLCPAQAQTIKDSVTKALDYHPAVKTAVARRDSAEERVKVERGALFPTVNFRGSTGYQYTDSPNTRTRATRGNDPKHYASLWRNEAGLFVTQLLYDGGRTLYLTDQARASSRAAFERINDARETTALQAIAAHIDILRNREFVRIAQANLGNHRAILGGIAQLSRQGRSTDADVSQASARLALADANLKLRDGQLREAIVRFEETVGTAPPPRMVLPGLPANLAALNGKTLAEKAEQENFAVRAAEREVESRRHALDATRGFFTPRLELEGSANYGHNLEGVRGPNSDARVLLVLTWNLYRGGADTARRKEALANLVATRYDADDTKRAARERVRQAFEQLQTTRARIGPLTQRVAASQAVVAAYARQFELGQRSLLDRLDALNELFIAQAELADARHTALFNYFSLLAATGELLTSLGIK